MGTSKRTHSGGFSFGKGLLPMLLIGGVAALFLLSRRSGQAASAQPSPAPTPEASIQQQYLSGQITEAQARAAFRAAYPEWADWQLQAEMNTLNLAKTRKV